jgi:hypothetical protein
MKFFAAIAALAVSLTCVQAELYSFSAITANDTNGLAQTTGEQQLYMDVTLLGAGQSSLVFTNTGPEISFISAIYFDFVPELDLTIGAIHDGGGVNFRMGPAKPENLPGGKGVDDVFIADLSTHATKPTSSKGINAYESLELIMNYDAAFDLIDALADKDLKVGLHVQGFAGGYSESFINRNDPGVTIPEPGTLSFLIAGGLILRRLRLY